jgi:hypothetical protein
MLSKVSPGGVWVSAIVEQIKIRGCDNIYAIHEKMSDGTWQTRYESRFPIAQEYLVPLKQPLWPLPSEPIEYGLDDELFKDIYRFLEYHLELRKKCYYTVMSCFVLMTWRIEEFDVVPYLFILGPKNTGKTRALEVLAQLCFRGWHITHPTPAVVFRIVDKYHPTLLADNYEFWPKETKNELDGLFNAGYRRGSYVPRCSRESNSDTDLFIYEVFSPKVLAGTRNPPDSLASRCIFIQTVRNTREIPFKIDLDWAQNLRDKLLTYRFRKFEERNINSAEAMNYYGRVREIFDPLLKVAPNKETIGELTDFALEVFQEQREEEAESFDAEVVRAVILCRDQAERGRLPIKNIVAALNEERDEQDKVRPQRVGWTLRRLGFKKARIPDAKGSYSIIIDSDLIERLALTYDIKNIGPTTPTSPESCSDAKSHRRNYGGF